MDVPSHIKCYRNVKFFRDGRYAGIYSFAFTDAIIQGTISDKEYYENMWCYKPGEADKALLEWDGIGEPSGWHRHPSTGRRRPDGDPNKEYINF